MAIEFMSQSARIPRLEKIKRVRRDSKIIESFITPSPTIYIGGKMDDEFKTFGRSLGFIIKPLAMDYSGIPQAKHIIFYEIIARDFMQKMSVINLGMSYGVRLTWIHSYIYPIHWMSQFDNVFVGEYTPQELWRVICDSLYRS